MNCIYSSAVMVVSAIRLVSAWMCSRETASGRVFCQASCTAFINGASGVVCGILGIGVSRRCTVRTLVLRVDALVAFHSGTFGALVLFGGVSGGTDCAGGSVICCAGCMVMSEFLTSATLVNGACGEELCDFAVFKQDNHFCAFEEVVLLAGPQGNHHAQGGLTDLFVGVRDVPWGLC
jgi:hypothetical protein